MARKPMSMHLDETRRAELEQIRNYHFGAGRSHMSMTHIIEKLIEREFKRLKLAPEQAKAG